MSTGKKKLFGLGIADLAVIAVMSFAIGIIAGCSDTGCLDNRSSIPYAGFYSYQTKQAIVLEGVEIGGIGAPNDSLLMKPEDRKTTIYLPFRFEYNNTSFFIRYVTLDPDLPGLADTLRFTYTSTPYFASEECGAMYNYQIETLNYTRHIIDSIAITDSLITNIDTQRIKIYFRTSEPDEGGEQ